MTLRNLLKHIMIQGDVRLSVWRNDEEIYVQDILGTDNLLHEDIKALLQFHVKYMFASPDEKLHIELEPGSAKAVI